jgi:hypothetical protein
VEHLMRKFAFSLRKRDSVEQHGTDDWQSAIHGDHILVASLNWRNIPITLIHREKGEGKAHACAIACSRQ